MWSFLSDLVRAPASTRTVVVMDADEVGTTRRYQLQPRRLLLVWGGTLLFAGAVASAAWTFTPLRTIIPGYGTETLRRDARLNALRVSALQDSLAVQRQYVRRLRQLITGQVDTAAASPSVAVQSPTRQSKPRERARTSVPSDTRPTADPSPEEEAAQTRRDVPVQISGNSGQPIGPAPPVRPPVEAGFPTRRFDAADGHYGLDIAVAEGTAVRSVGEGYVVLADWTRRGGYTIAVQHAGGYLSVYKHNKRLLKQTGDHVRAREAVATSGNTGEATTGPHVHFELWQHGLAQNPRSYLTDW